MILYDYVNIESQPPGETVRIRGTRSETEIGDSLLVWSESSTLPNPSESDQVYQKGDLISTENPSSVYV